MFRIKLRHGLRIAILGMIVLVGVVHAQTTTAPGNDITKLNETIAKKRQVVEELEKSIAKVKKDIDKKRLEATSLKNQLGILDSRITQVELDVELTQEKLDTTALEIQSLNLGIDAKRQTIANQKRIIAELIRTVSYEDDKTYIEIMAVYESFSDFYNRVQYLENVEEDLGKSVKALRLAKEDLETKRQLSEERKRAYSALQNELLEKKQDLDEQIYSKQKLLSQTKSSEATFNTLLGSLRKQYQQTEQEIASIEKEVRKKLDEQAQLERLNNAGGNASVLSWPTQSRYITARFHDPDYPFRNVFEHNAVDIRAAQGTTIKAAASGYVGRAKHCTNSTCYSYVMLIHADGMATLYGHLSSIRVQEEQFVTRGDLIGYSGGTPGTIGAGPFVTGPHLHFEVRKNGIPVNPLNYLVKDY